ncbi:hypothetical protein P7H47_07510 [Enterococcus cecorum]|uniref:Uncharacterized protein n=1 Tax=Enterococcus cecorum TaxID=44008 RepID=A0AAW8TRL0_9ENTE|nr:hypothetical protein [Enterococcus cecorum]MDT2797086.1 hypothetical protein [Enterococcus cecorum]
MGRKSNEELEGEREIILIDCNFSFSINMIRLVRDMWRDGYKYKYIAEILNLKEIDVVLILVHLMHKSRMIK